MKLAQGIVCGAWAMAFPFDWARQIVDKFELSVVPKAPHWLLGSSNFEGSILPVVDLSIYFGVSNSQITADQRLLVGGLQGVQTDDAIALNFNGLPQQIQYEPAPLTYASALPAKLRELCTGIARDSTGRDFLEISASALIAALGDELSQI